MSRIRKHNHTPRSLNTGLFTGVAVVEAAGMVYTAYDYAHAGILWGYLASLAVFVIAIALALYWVWSS